MRLARSSLAGHPAVVAGAGLLGGAALAAVAGLAAAGGHGSALLAAGIAVIGVSAVMRWPALTVFALLVTCQEMEPGQGFASGSGLLFLGHQLYFTTAGRISMLTFVLVLAVARIGLVDPPRRLRLGGVGLVALMGAWYAGTVWLGGLALTSAINQDARFALLFVLAFVIGAWARRNHDWQSHGPRVLIGVITLMALIGSYLAGTGQGVAEGGLNIIFYDSAMGAAAGAIVLAVALAPREIRTWRIWWLGGAAMIIVLLSSRRNVWAAMIVALLTGLAVARNRTRIVLRGVSAIVGLLIIVAVFAPSVMNELGHQLSAIWQATQGSAADNSTQGHLSDISVGWRAVLAHPLAGVGAAGHLPGLVVEDGGTLYIHNQVLESWLRFGIVGAILLVAVQTILLLRALPVLRRHSHDLTVSWAALFLIMAPVTMLTAPFFTETQRWPALVGFAAGLISARDRESSRGAESAAISAPAAPREPV